MVTLEETVSIVRNLGITKVHKRFNEKMILSIIAGAAIAFGYIAYFRTAAFVEGGLGVILGAAFFPMGLMIVLMVGGELLTGNMMVVGTAWLHKDVSTKDLLLNWLHITVGNLIGASIIALVYGFYLGSVDVTSVLIKDTVLIKMADTPIQMIISGIGCNIFVGISVWMYLSAKDGFLKFIAIWFPITVFVILGFQHVVANMFVLVLGLGTNTITFTQYLVNIVNVFIGNALGGVIFVGLLYSLVAGSLKQ